MKKIFVFSSLMFLFLQASSAGITAYMRNCVFRSVNDSAYVETQFTIPAKNLRFTQREDKKWEAAIQITLFYMQDTTVIKHLKYILFSEAIADTNNLKFNLADLKRVTLPNGNYSVELYLQDDNFKDSKGFLTEGISIKYAPDSVSFSDIELVDYYDIAKEKSIYTKHGYEIQPYTIEYYPTALSKLTFYAEVYHTDKIFNQDNFLTSIYIRESLSGKPMEHFIFNSKQSPEPIKVLFSSFDISSLPTGSYFLTIELRNKRNEKVAEQNLYFLRTNTAIVFNPKQLDSVQVEKDFAASMPDDSLNFYVQSLFPIADNDEHNYIDYFKKSTDYSAMRAMLYKFWVKRNPQSPLAEWKKYKQSVYEVENNFSTQVKHGYSTDRGRVYLQYGPPSDINKSSQEPGTYPYEIWHYYFIEPNQSDIHFVFSNPDLVSNNYKLIHSDAIGELKDPRWKFKLHDAFKNKNATNPDATELPDSFGSHVDDFMK